MSIPSATQDICPTVEYTCTSNDISYRVVKTSIGYVIPEADFEKIDEAGRKKIFAIYADNQKLYTDLDEERAFSNRRIANLEKTHEDDTKDLRNEVKKAIVVFIIAVIVATILAVTLIVIVKTCALIPLCLLVA